LKDSKINSTNEVTDIFQKKQECIKYEERARRAMDSEAAPWKEYNGEGDIMTAYTNLEKICYSRESNTCLAFYEVELSENGKKTTQLRYRVYDVLSEDVVAGAIVFNPYEGDGSKGVTYLTEKNELLSKFLCE